MDAKKVARGLGWFSIGLGLTEVLAPGKLESMLGIKRNRGILRTFGLREIAAGVALLAEPDQAKWVWGRVAGDALDIAALAAALPKSYRRNGVIFALANVLAVTAVDIATAIELSNDTTKRRRLRAAA